MRALPSAVPPLTGAPAELLSPWAAPGRPHNLAQPLTSFIGREREIAEVERLLDATRLLTLTGTGGIGKTRLGQEVAGRLLGRPIHAEPSYRDGIWLVQLAALVSPTRVSEAVATALGVAEDAETSPTERLIAALQAKTLLLILDSCEHLVEPCASLAAALLRACPGLRILATSRQPLGVDGETVLRVPPLALPAARTGPGAPSAADAGTPAGSQPLASSPADSCEPLAEAVQLFVERARAAAPDFSLAGSAMEAVEHICRRLDGIPLAIELAAARVAVLGPAQIADRLSDRYRFLTGGSRTALPRYRTLRALIDWSHDLLDESERVLFRRLAVFGGSWTLEAAEAVCADPLAGAAPALSSPKGRVLARDEILDLLSGLVAKSLVLTDGDRSAGEHDREMRFTFLESLRAYAAEKLREASEEAPLRERHCDWLLALAERIEPELQGPRSTWWMDRLEGERDNLYAALAWSVEQDAGEAGLRIVSALSRFWQIRGPYREIRALIAGLLALRSANQRTVSVQTARMRALLTAGVLALRQDDRAAAAASFQESLDLSRLLGDRRGLAMGLVSMARIAHLRSDRAAADAYRSEAMQVFEQLGDDLWLAKVHHHQGVAAYGQGDLPAARTQFETCLAIFERLGDELGILTALEQLGEVALEEGDLEAARPLLRTSLTMARRLDDKDRAAMALAALGGLAAAQGRPAQAVRLAATALALMEAAGQRNSPAWYARVERWLQPARRALTADAYAAEEAAGRAMSLDAAIVEASADAGERPAGLPSPVGAAPERPARPLAALVPGTGALSPRELQVAALVAQGLTNRQIAETLVITEGTAANHVKHILARLAFDSRVQIATWAIGHGLHRRAAS